MGWKIRKDVYDRIAPKLAGDTATLAQAATAGRILPIVAPFADTINLARADLDTETADQLMMAADMTTGAQQEAIDPVTGSGVVECINAGAMRMELGADADPEPITVYGFLYTNDAETAIYAVCKLETPVTLSLAGHFVTVPAVVLEIPKSAF